MPTLTLPRVLRAALGPRRTPPQPNPTPIRVPAPRRPAAATDGAGLRLSGDPDPAPPLRPQAQGDVIVLPWPDFMSPHLRYLHTASSAPLPRAGLGVHASHVLLAESGAVFWAPWPDPDAPTLGTLVVPAAAVARLAHDEHTDLRIGPGIYAVRRQRRDVPRSAPVLVED